MSCYVLQPESFEALAASLAHYKIRVPSTHAPVMVADPEAWAALAWAASDCNAAAYAHRYREPVNVHPLEVKHGTFEAFAAWFRAWCEPQIIRMTGPRPRSEVALCKLLVCMSYQIADAPAGSEARVIGEELHRLAAEIASLTSRASA